VLAGADGPATTVQPHRRLGMLSCSPAYRHGCLRWPADVLVRAGSPPAHRSDNREPQPDNSASFSSMTSEGAWNSERDQRRHGASNRPRRTVPQRGAKETVPPAARWLGRSFPGASPVARQLVVMPAASRDGPGGCVHVLCHRALPGGAVDLGIY
jgi:hypothetical protein